MRRLLLILPLALSACMIAAAAPLLPAELSPAAQEIPFSRNAGKPAGQGHLTLDRGLELGSTVYAIPAPAAWKETLAKLDPERKDNPLPIVFAGEMSFPGGKTALAVAQLAVVMKGDGNFRPGPVIVCLLYSLDTSAASGPVLLWKGSHPLGTLQNSRVHRGTLAPGKDAFTLKLAGGDAGPVDKPTTLHLRTGEGFTLTAAQP